MFRTRLGIALLLAASTAAQAAAFEVLTSSRAISAFAYATDDVVEETDQDSLSAPALAPFSEMVTAEVTMGPIVSNSWGSQTSSFGVASIHGEGAHFAFSEDSGTVGFGISGGSSTLDVQFRIDASTGFQVEGFVEGFDLGWSSVTLSGPGGTVFSRLAGGQHIDFDQSGNLAPGDYSLNVYSSGSAHGWPPFPSYSSGAFEVHLALDLASDAPLVSTPEHLVVIPNPFRSVAHITLPRGASVLRIYDATGRIVRTFRGSAEIDWDGQDDRNLFLPSGVYFLKAEGGTESDATKVVRLR